jgi:hypothetical protein
LHGYFYPAEKWVTMALLHREAGAKSKLGQTAIRAGHFGFTWNRTSLSEIVCHSD